MRENKDRIIVNYSRLTPYECQSHECSNTFNKIQKANLEKNVNKLMKLANNKNEAQKNISEINNTILKIKNILERNKKRWKQKIQKKLQLLN